MPTQHSRGARPLHFAIAVFAAGTAAAIRLSLTPFLADRNQLVMFYPAIMLSAWLGGVWPGVVATGVSAVLDGYMFVEPVFTLRLPSHGDKVVLAIFIVTGITISVLNENLRRAAALEQQARDGAERARDDAERARADADAANRTKDFFMAAVSHDLRAPMNAALGWADMLGKNVLDEEPRQHAVEAIRRALSRQSALVNDLLDHAAILAGKLRVEQKPVDVEAVVRSGVEIAEPLAAPKRLHFRVECDDSRPTVVGDVLRLQQVVSNLLANAIKFSPEDGHVDVRVRRAASHAEIQVSDTGKGISKDALPLVFERFWQAHGATTGPHTGIGLGLSIVKHLVAAHGGTVEVMSEGEGHGATFSIRLPLAESPAMGYAQAQQQSSNV